MFRASFLDAYWASRISLAFRTAHFSSYRVRKTAKHRKHIAIAKHHRKMRVILGSSSVTGIMSQEMTRKTTSVSTIVVAYEMRSPKDHGIPSYKKIESVITTAGIV